METVRCFLDPVRGGRESTVCFMADLSGGRGGSFSGTLHRTSRRRTVRLIVDERGLTVLVPRLFRPERDLEGLLERNLDWILQGLSRASLRPRDAGRGPIALPGVVRIPALSEEWRVEVAEAARTSAFEGIIPLPSGLSRAEALRALRDWVRLRAKQTLPPMLLELAAEQGLTVARVAVKEMRSRWGSCSARHNVNLNSRLLFLSPDLVRHVMLHELCHMAEMNHSPAFYARLRAMDPETDRHRQELRSAWRCLPPWASEPL